MKVLAIKDLLSKIGQTVWVEKKAGELPVCSCEVVFDVAGLAFGVAKTCLVTGSMQADSFLPLHEMNVSWRPWDEQPTEEAMISTPWVFDEEMHDWINQVRFTVYREGTNDETDPAPEPDAKDEVDEETKLKPKYLAYYTWYKNGLDDMLRRVETIQGDIEGIKGTDTLSTIRAEIEKQLMAQIKYALTCDVEDMKREALSLLLDTQADDDGDLLGD